MTNEIRCTEPFLDVLKKSLIYVMSVDKVIERSEQDKLKEVYNETAPAPLPLSVLVEDIISFENWSPDFFNTVQNAALNFNNTEKEKILSSNISVIVADGIIHPKEKEFFSQLAKALSFPDADLEKMLSTLLKPPTIK